VRSFWKRLASRLGLPPAGRRTYALEAGLYQELTDLAARERRPADDLAAELIAGGLRRRLGQEGLWQAWQSLSPREQDAAALACLGYTNRQIAARLTVSAETVKTHLHHALVKFDLHSRNELRLLMAGWDFSAWEADEKPPLPPPND
jgi:DNA-binding CsgD family transcriptional regulator